MKRLPIAAAAVLAGTMPFRSEPEDPRCKEATCANEPVATIPENPHSLEEWPIYDIDEDTVAIALSPPVSAKRGSPTHLRWIRENEEAAARRRIMS